METSTIETQELIVSALMKDSYLFSMSKEEMTDGYFSSPACKVIYKALVVYYNKYSTIPQLSELLITIENCYNPQIGTSLDEVKDTCRRLYNAKQPSEEFVRDKLTDFIRKVRTSKVLQDFLEDMKKGADFETDNAVQKLASALEVQLNSTKVFSMDDIDQVREARNTAVGSDDQSRIIKSFISGLNGTLMFKGWQPSTVNMMVSPPGTGKTMYLINEGVCAAKQGFNVLHIFIGDMVEYDGFIRYLSCVSGMPQGNLVMIPVDKQLEIVKYCNQQHNDIFSRLKILAYPSLTITVDTLIEDVNKFEKQLNVDFDMIIVDYPDNLILNGDSLYTDGGTLYSSLEKMARFTQSVILTASQPQKAYWQHTVIPLEAAAESSKKQQCVDVMLTMNTEYRGANFGTMLLAKARKGEVGKIFRFKTDFDKCLMEEINEATYNALKASSKGSEKT